MKHDVRARSAAFVLALVVGVMAVMFLIGSASAADKDPYSNRGPKVLPSVIDRDEPDRPDVVEHERIPSPPPDTPKDERSPLPFTGADLTLFVATGLAAVATGSVIVRRTRSRSVQ